MEELLDIDHEDIIGADHGWAPSNYTVVNHSWLKDHNDDARGGGDSRHFQYAYCILRSR